MKLRILAVAGVGLVLVVAAVAVWMITQSRETENPRAPVKSPLIKDEKPEVDLIHVEGPCPSCGSHVKGSLYFWDGRRDSDGMPVSGSDYRAECPCCKKNLVAKKVDLVTHKAEWSMVQ